MHLLAISTSQQKCFHIDTAENASTALSLPKPIANALRERKRPGARTEKKGRKCIAYARAHDCLVTTVDVPSRVHFHQNFSKNFTRLRVDATPSQQVSANFKDVVAEGKAERRQRLKRERLERRGRALENTEPHTVEAQAPEDVTALCLMPSATYSLTAGSHGGLAVWDVPSGALRSHTPLMHIGAIATLSVSDDQRRLLTSGADEFVRLWDLEELCRRSGDAANRPKPLAEFLFPKVRITQLRFFPMSPELALCASADGFLRFLRLPTGAIFFEKQFGEALREVGFSPCAQYAIVSTASAKLIAVRVTPVETRERIRAHLERPLTTPYVPPADPFLATADDTVRMALRDSQRAWAHLQESEFISKPPVVQLDGTSAPPGALYADFAHNCVGVLDAAGAVKHWDLRAAFERLRGGEDAGCASSAECVIHPLQSALPAIAGPIDYACALGSSFIPPKKRQAAPSAPLMQKTRKGIDVDEAFSRPITMPAAKQALHEQRARARARVPVPEPPTMEPEDDGFDAIPGMIRLESAGNFGERIGARIELQNAIQKLRDEIFECEKVANELNEQKRVQLGDDVPVGAEV